MGIYDPINERSYWDRMSVTHSFGGAEPFRAVPMFNGSGLFETGASKVKYAGCKGGSIVLIIMVEWRYVRMKSVAWSGECEFDDAPDLDGRMVV